jgi:hypothetical protein
VLWWDSCVKAGQEKWAGREKNEVWQVLLAAETRLNEPVIFPKPVPS